MAKQPDDRKSQLVDNLEAIMKANEAKELEQLLLRALIARSLSGQRGGSTPDVPHETEDSAPDASKDPVFYGIPEKPREQDFTDPEEFEERYSAWMHVYAPVIRMRLRLAKASGGSKDSQPQQRFPDEEPST